VAHGVDAATAAVDGYSLAFRVGAGVLFAGAAASVMFMRNVRSTFVQPGMEDIALAGKSATSVGASGSLGS
jgi:hypothetical protein